MGEPAAFTPEARAEVRARARAIVEAIRADEDVLEVAERDAMHVDWRGFSHVIEALALEVVALEVERYQRHPMAPERCPVCEWTNAGIMNYGKPGAPRWACHGCAANLIAERDAAVSRGEVRRG